MGRSPIEVMTFACVVIMGIGAVPNAALARKARLDIGPGKGIQLDRYICSPAIQTGTRPAFTASPIAYQLVNAAEMAIAASWRSSGT
jgi:hypothetical protein